MTNVKTVKEITQFYLDVNVPEKKIKSAETSMYNIKAINRYFGDMPYLEIKPHHLSSYKTERYDKYGVGENTVRRELCIFRACIQAALDLEYIDVYDDNGDYTREKKLATIVMGRISKMKPAAVKRDAIPSHEEFQNILKYLPIDVRNIATAAGLTAYRKGELRQLRWFHVDFDREMIHLPKELSKNGKKRDTPMYPELLQYMRKMRQYNQDREFNLDYCFLNLKGKPYARHSLFRRWRKAVKNAGYIDENGKHRFNFHDTRRYGVRYLMDVYHMPEDMVMKCYSGHLTREIFIQIYAGLSPDSMRHFRDIAKNCK